MARLGHATRAGSWRITYPLCMDAIILYFAYLAGVAGSAAWVYRDAKKHGHGHPRSVALGTAVLFPVGILFYIMSR